MHDMSNRQTQRKDYYGARWVRTDLHLHSPGVHTFALPSGLDPRNAQYRERIVEQYVEQLAAQDIRIAAITDYQGVRKEWFAPIQQLARKQDIYVYPGAEISFTSAGKYGLHILAIFRYEEELDSINRCIQSLHHRHSEELVSHDGCHRDIQPEKRIEDALRTLRDELDAILIVPHPDDNNGLFKTYQWKDSASFLREVRPEAVENFREDHVYRLQSTDLLDERQCRRFASVAFSDPKRIEEIGTKTSADGRRRATWLKLCVLDDLQAIRLALRDPEILVATGSAPEIRYTHLVSLEVDGTGFLGQMRIVFSPEHNILVGGRGVGKSAIIETLRYALDIPAFAPTEYREELVRYALGSGGKAIVHLQQVVQGKSRLYRVERVWGEPPRVFDLEAERLTELSPQSILGEELPLLFGQREIYEVARDERLRLQLLDAFLGRQAQSQMRQQKRIENDLRENTSQILRLQKALREKEEVQQRLREIEHEIELYKRTGIAEKLKQATRLASDEQRLVQVREGLETALTEWRDLQSLWAERWRSYSQLLAGGESEHRRLLEEYRTFLQRLHDRFEELFRRGREDMEQTLKELERYWQRWQEERRAVDEQIRQVKQELGKEALDPDQLIRLTQEQQQLLPRLETFQQMEKQLEQLRAQRRSLLGQLGDVRWEIWRLRHQRAQEVKARLQGRVDVEVTYKGNAPSFAERLAELLRGSGIDRSSIEKLCKKEGVDGQTIAQAVRDGTTAIQEYGLTEGRAQQLQTFLQQNEARWMELETLAPEDAVRVYLKVGESKQSLEKLSVGQKATAMLLLVLSELGRPLVVDQPEDDLDNRFVYEDIVQILRSQKGSRQLIAATHNPNIPVLGHAELVLALEASEERARIRAQGALDRKEVREFIKQVMEGGEEAFRRRAEKYGWA